jgi:hypothetical protein
VRRARRRSTQVAGFALLALVGELTGRSVTLRVDRMLAVRPRVTPMASYYPFLLAGIRIAAAVALAAVVWRLVRAHLTASAGESLLRGLGHRHPGAPRLRVSITPRLWLAAFGATALWYLIQNDSERVYEGRWPLFAPWLHTYALPVFAVVSVLVAVGWAAVRDWLAEVERYATATFAIVYRALRHGQAAPALRRSRPCDDRAPRHLFGEAFDSRPPPLPA